MITYFLCFLFIFFAMMRGLEVGTDHLGYRSDFFSLRSIEGSSKQMGHRFEIGYVAILLLFKQISNDYLTFTALTFLPFFIGYYIFIRQYKANMPLALFIWFFLGFYFFAYNGMRQAMCMGLILPFTYLVQSGRYVKYMCIVVTFSILFHLSSVLFLILIPIHWYVTNRSWNNKSLLYLLLILSYLSFWIGRALFQDVLTLLIIIFGLGDFSVYINGAEVKGLSNTISTGYTLFALIVVYCANLHKYKFEVCIFVLAICVFNIFNILTEFSSRVYWPFYSFAIVLLPLLIYDKSTRYRHILFGTTMVICIVFFYSRYYVGKIEGIEPYYYR